MKIATSTGIAVVFLERGGSMGVFCCSKVRTARIFRLSPKEGYVFCEVSFLKNCSQCGKAVLEIERISAGGAHSVIRYRGSRAQSTFESLQKSILFELERCSGVRNGGFYLGYGEFGRKRRCYSNLSGLKCGIFESLPLPKRNLTLPRRDFT